MEALLKFIHHIALMTLVFGLLHPFHFGRLILLVLLTVKGYSNLAYYTGLLCANNSVSKETYLDAFAGNKRIIIIKKELFRVLPKKQKHSQGKRKLCYMVDGKPLSDNFSKLAEGCTLPTNS